MCSYRRYRLNRLHNEYSLFFVAETMTLGEINPCLLQTHTEQMGNGVWIASRLALMNKCLKRIASKRDDACHMEWMTMGYTADQLVFLDESSKDERVVLGRYGPDKMPSTMSPWSLSFPILSFIQGFIFTKRIVMVPNVLKKYLMWPCIPIRLLAPERRTSILPFPSHVQEEDHIDI